MLHIFGFERTWWRLFQKHVMRTKFDIYVFNRPIWLSNLGPLCCLLPKTFKLFGFTILWLLAYLTKVILLNLVSFYCYHWIDTSTGGLLVRGYLPPSSQCCCTVMGYKIYLYQNLQFLNHIVISKTKVPVPQI
jgi:hypothetical protein